MLALIVWVRWLMEIRDQIRSILKEKGPTSVDFTPVIFSMFNAWTKQQSHGDDGGEGDDRSSRHDRIARGQTLFNSKSINITGVAGLNDDLNLASIPGTCGTCHDSPNVGNHSVSAPLNIGVDDVNSSLDVSYLPIITLQNKTTMEIRTTTDVLLFSWCSQEVDAG